MCISGGHILPEMDDGRIKKCMKNKGMASVEAVIVIPCFLFAFMMMYHMVNIISLKTVVYEATAQTAEYLAEYAYLADITDLKTVGLTKIKFSSYLDDPELVKSYVSNGISGISFQGSELPDQDGNIVIMVRYTIKLPGLGITTDISFKFVQKAYLGKKILSGTNISEDDIYVYITDNCEVYHINRSCSHLELKISIKEYESVKKKGQGNVLFAGGKQGIMYI